MKGHTAWVSSVGKGRNTMTATDPSEKGMRGERRREKWGRFQVSIDLEES